jgi:hypothetical protein
MKNAESIADKDMANKTAMPSPPDSQIETAAPVHIVDEARKQ